MDPTSYSAMDFKMLNRLRDLQVAAANAFLSKNFAKAAEYLEESYKIVVEQQNTLNRRFHKGWQLHNWGIALLELGKAAEGSRLIFLAYVEDALSTDLGNEDAADSELAGIVLRGTGNFDRLLDSIKATAKVAKETGDLPMDPEDAFGKALLQVVVKPNGLEEAGERLREERAGGRRRIEDVSSPHEKRCFLGGAYRKGGNLTDLRDMIKADGFDPILVNDFEVDEQQTHHRSLLLLHMCHRAIFDVTNQAGQLMELERCRDYDIQPLILHQVLEDANLEAPLMIASMVRGRVQAYSRIEELRELVHGYLSQDEEGTS